MDISLKNKNAVICGSSQGIGLATAQELALNGANCFFWPAIGIIAAGSEQFSKSATQQHRGITVDFNVRLQWNRRLKS